MRLRYIEDENWYHDGSSQIYNYVISERKTNIFFLSSIKQEILIELELVAQ